MQTFSMLLHYSIRSPQAHQLAERAQLFSEGLGVLTHDCFSTDGDGGDAEGSLRDQCREMRAQIKQVREHCSTTDERGNWSE